MRDSSASLYQTIEIRPWCSGIVSSLLACTAAKGRLLVEISFGLPGEASLCAAAREAAPRVPFLDFVVGPDEQTFLSTVYSHPTLHSCYLTLVIWWARCITRGKVSQVYNLGTGRPNV